MCMMFAEKLKTVRGHLVAHIKVDETLLSYMMEKIKITRQQKDDMLHVCTPSLVIVFVMSFSTLHNP